MSMKSKGCGLAVAALLPALLASEAMAQAGLMTGGAVKLEPITLASGKPLAAAPYELQAG
jgi:hypothetical protein